MQLYHAALLAISPSSQIGLALLPRNRSGVIARSVFCDEAIPALRLLEATGGIASQKSLAMTDRAERLRSRNGMRLAKLARL